jgi:hypothetical protein
MLSAPDRARSAKVVGWHAVRFLARREVDHVVAMRPHSLIVAELPGVSPPVSPDTDAMAQAVRREVTRPHRPRKRTPAATCEDRVQTVSSHDHRSMEITPKAATQFEEPGGGYELGSAGAISYFGRKTNDACGSTVFPAWLRTRLLAVFVTTSASGVMSSASGCLAGTSLRVDFANGSERGASNAMSTLRTIVASTNRSRSFVVVAPWS